MTEQTRLGRMQLWPVDKLVPYAGNPRTHSDEQVAKIAASIQEFGFTNPILIAENSILAGHGRLRAAQLLGLAQVPVIDFSHLGEAQRRAYVIADNRLALDAGWDEELLAQELRSLQTDDFDLALLGFTDEELRGLLAEIAPDDRGAGEPTLLADRFVAPPFSVLDARQGYWQNRKRAWLSLGITSELGRRENLLRFSPMINAAKAGEYSTKEGPYVAHREYDNSGYSGGDAWAAEGSSVFDPMLCELAYRWFCPNGGTVLDPFAGGSVRGVVAGKLGRRYVGVDLSRPQIEANELQAAQMFGEETPTTPGLAELETLSDPAELSPVQAVAPDIWLKRDDLFEYNGGRGSKVRTALVMLEGAAGVTVAGNRASPMISRVARVAERMGIPCRAHVAGSNQLSPEEADAAAHGAELVKGNAQYLSALVSQARKDAEARGWVFMPLGMEGPQYIAQTRRQAVNIPAEVSRLVVTVGTGMALSGILHGLDDVGRGSLPVLGVVVGMDPEPYLDKWAPANWRERVTLVKHAQDFRVSSKRHQWWGVELDAHYEAKAAEHVRRGDCLWCVAIRATAVEPRALAPAAPAEPLVFRRAGGPEWAKGYELGQLRAVAALFKQHDAPYALGAFAAVKEAQVAEWLSTRCLTVLERAGVPVAALATNPAPRSAVRDFAGRVLGTHAPGETYVRRMAGEPTLLAMLLDEAGAAGWLELWQECAQDRELAQALGFRWLGSKIRASSEIVGVWRRGPNDDSRETPWQEQAALVRLSLPELDVRPLAAALARLDQPFADHYSTYNKRKSWSALALRGYGGDPAFIIKPAEMSKQWKAENAQAMAYELLDTPLRAQLPEAEALISAIPGVKHRVRLMRLAPRNGELTRHADITDPDAGVEPGRLLRIHIPIETNPQVQFQQWLLTGERIGAHMPAGSAWYLDTRKPHTAVNNGERPRIHLVLDVESSPALLALLERGNQTPALAAANAAPEIGELLTLPAKDSQRPEWRCGDSRQLAELCADVDADFIFSCPPYGDLERYSEDPRDISNMHHADFLSAYREIIAAAVSRLKPDRFACFVVGDIRGPDGAYRNFVAATVQAFMDAGASLYNDAVLITATGTLPLRAGRNFSASRKLGKAHQNVLVFLKGHAARAVAACGPVDVTLPAGMTFDAPEEESASVS